MSGVGFYLIAWLGFLAVLVGVLALGRIYDREEADQ